MRIAPLLLAAALLAAPVLPAAAQAPQGRGAATLHLAVADDSTGRPLEGARVTVSGVRGVALSGEDGAARVRGVSPGAHVVQVSLPGYALRRFPVEAAPGQALSLPVRLVPQHQEVMLEGLTVTSWGRSVALRNRGFYDRMNLGTSASFLTREDVQNARPQQLIDVFRRIRGFQLVPNRRGTTASGYTLMTTRGQGLGPCYPDVYLDGMVMRSPDGRADVLYNFSWEHVEGIEAFPSPATIPAEYARNGAACAVVLLWTR